ncbi:MAG: hypothetical protein IJU35_00445 [Paludibacteraceae bacterium]|nr:hypothetical protein [Paludibacteraceae bacterium]
MKHRLFLLSILTLMACTLAFGRGINMQPFARQFVAIHFTERMVIVENCDGDCEITLDDGTELQFSDDGEWEIKAESSEYGIPFTVLPERAMKIAELKFNGVRMISAEQDDDGEISCEFENGGEIVCRSDGTIIEFKLK